MNFKSLYILNFVFVFGFGALNKDNPNISTEDKVLIQELRERLLKNIARNANALDASTDESIKEAAETERWLGFHSSYLLNWLEFYYKNLDATEAALMNSIQWRTKNNVDRVLSWTPPKFFVDNFPYNITGLTEDGTPILYIPGGIWPLRDGLVHRSDMLRYMIHMVETVVEEVHQIYKNKTEEPSGKFIGVLDLKDLKLRQISSIRVLSFLANALQIYEAHYPFSQQEIVFINAPGIFEIVLRVVKQVLSNRTLERLTMFDSNKARWEPHLRNLIPEKLYPKQLL